MVSDTANIVALCGMISSQFMNLSTLPAVMEIIRAKSTLSYSAFPFVIGFVAGVTGTVYAALTNQVIAIISNILYLTTVSVSLGVHLLYSSQKNRISRQLGILLTSTIFSAALIPICMCSMRANDCEDSSIVWVGIVNLIVNSVAYCGQLSTFSQVIATRNSASISPWLTGGTLLSASIWLIYAIIVEDNLYVACFMIGVMSGIAQIVLLVKYPRKAIFNPLASETVPTKDTGSMLSETTEPDILA